MKCIIFYKYQLLVTLKSVTTEHKEAIEQIELPTKSDINHILNILHNLYTDENTLSAILIDSKNLNFNSEHFPDDLQLNQSKHTKLKLISLRPALNNFSTQVISNIIYYKQLQDYYRTQKFCGTCGNKTIIHKQNKFVRCSNCQHEIYPQIAPCVIVRIHKGNQILMAKGVNYVPNAWGLIAGFVEINERLEDAVIREVKEEVGIEVENLKYWGSQSWPFPSNSLLVCFTADYKSGEIKPDTTEIIEAGFFSSNNIPGKPSTRYSITSQMIEDFITHY